MQSTTIDIKHILGTLSNKHFALTLMPTEKCNFRCTYCYEDFMIGKMSKQTRAGIKNLLSARLPELQTLSIEWFGGEPLLAHDVIYDIGAYVKEKLKEYPHVRYTSGMTTNAYLLKGEIFNKMMELDVRSFQISLDGPKHVHDKTRLKANKEGTFDEIWSNLIKIKESKESLKIVIRVHVTPENHGEIPALLEDIKKEFGNDKRFQVFLKAIEDLGGSNGGTFKILSGMDKKEILKKLNEQLSDVIESKKLSTEESPYICYASKPNHLVIRGNGCIAKCTVVFDDARNNIGKINEDGTLTVDNDKLNLWTRGLQTLDKNTLYCPLHGLPALESKKTEFPVKIVKSV